MLNKLICTTPAFLFLACSSPKMLKPELNKASATQINHPDHYKDLKFDEFNYVTPKPQDFRHEIAPGVIAYLIPDNRLPRIQMIGYFVENGYSSDSLKLAANHIMSNLLINAGGSIYSADKVADTLEFASAYLGAQTGMTHSEISLDVVTKDFDTYLPLLQELLLKPNFDSSRVELTKTKVLQNILHKYDHPASLASDLFSEVMYGKHPYYWGLKADEIPPLNSEDLKKEASQFFQSDTIYLGVSGDFELEKMKSTLKSWVEKWPRKGAKKADIAAPVVIAKPGVWIIDKETEQTQINIGQPFIQRPHPDYYPASIASYILGSGGFTSRLVAEVRTKHGLAYSIRSSTGSKYDYQAVTNISLQTKVQSTLQALDLIKKELVKLINEGPTDDEINKAKESLIASIPSIFSSSNETMNAFLANELDHREFDHFEKYAERLRNVSREQIMDAYKKYFNPDNMSITLVGPLNKINEADSTLKLSDFGEIHQLNISDLEKRK